MLGFCKIKSHPTPREKKHSEAYIERTVVKYAEELGWQQLKLDGTTSAGKPDRVFWLKNKFIFIEFKKWGGRVSPRQRAWQEINYNKTGRPIYYIDNIRAGKEFFDAISK